jgi:excisionase family DNA binding protein
VTKNCSDVCRKRAYKLRQREEKIKASLIEQQTTLATIKKSVGRKPVQHQDLNDKQFMSINEISDLIGVSRWSIQRMLKRGEIPFKQFGRKKIINRQELEKLFK